MDGGRKRWELDGHPLPNEVVRREPTTYGVHEHYSLIRTFRDEVIDGARHLSFLDICSPEEFAGRLLAPAHLPQDRSEEDRSQA